jgi:hypothetical protein
MIARSLFGESVARDSFPAIHKKEKAESVFEFSL